MPSETAPELGDPELAVDFTRRGWLVSALDPGRRRGVSLVVLVTVTTVLLYAVLRRRATGVPLPLVPGRERWTAVAVASATALTVVTLLVLLIASSLTGHALDDRARADRERTAASGRQP